MTVGKGEVMARRELKVALLASACLICLAGHSSAQSIQDFDIPSVDLETALEIYRRQADQSLVYRLDDVRGASANPVHGSLPADMALERMLENTPFTVHRSANGALAIVKASLETDAPVAQTTTQAVPRAQPGPGSSAPPNGDEAIENIVVTGSRIVRRDYTANSPIATVEAEELASVGAPTVETYLNQLPQFVGSATASSNSPNNSGQANLDLRGLGRSRTLVLLDGRRLVPANSDGSVDVNVIPRILIENVEVITGGASAVYGSDAIAGVVNFRLNTSFTGALYDVQYGLTERGDAQTVDVAAAFGGSVDNGRGHALVALSYSEREAVYGDARDFPIGWGQSSTVPQGAYAAIGSNLPTQGAVDSVFAEYGVAPGTVRPNANLSFNEDGTLFSATGGVHNYRGEDPIYDASGSSFFYQAYGSNLIQLPLERYSGFGRGHYELGSGVEAFGQLLFTQYEARTLQAPAPAAGNPQANGTGFWVPVTNPFIPSGLAAILASRLDPDADFLLNKRLITSEGRARTTTYTTYQMTTGLRGDIDAIDGGWELTGSYGRNDYSQLLEGSISHSAASALLAAPDGGAALCAGGYDPFGISILSDECTAFLERTAKNNTIVAQRVVEANVQGRLATLPAGEARFAAGLGYREDEYEFIADNLLMGGDVIGMLAVQPLSGRTDVREAYGEVLVPLVRDLPFARSVDLGLGYRYSDYSSVGGVSSYKAEADWRVTEGVRVRGSYQRAVRAPSIGELLSPPSRSRPAFGTASLTSTNGDPCDVQGSYRNGPDAAAVRALCLTQGVPEAVIDNYTYANNQTYATNRGNIELDEETADTFSVGLVWHSQARGPWLSGLSVSLDYYSISVEGAVGAIPAVTSIRNCFNLDGANPTYDIGNTYCSVIERDLATGDILNVDEQLGNLGEIRTSGIDLAVNWRAGLEELGLAQLGGDIGVSLLATYLDRYEISDMPGMPLVNYAGSIGSTLASAYPELKLVTNFSYERGPWRGSLRWRYLDSMRDRSLVGAAPGAVAVSPPSVNYFDLDLRWRLNDVVQLRAGVINLLDKEPPFYSSNVQMNTDPSTYDTLGRRYHIGLSAHF